MRRRGRCAPHKADGQADTATAQDVEIIVDNYINLAHTMNFYQKRDGGVPQVFPMPCSMPC